MRWQKIGMKMPFSGQGRWQTSRAAGIYEIGAHGCRAKARRHRPERMGLVVAEGFQHPPRGF